MSWDDNFSLSSFFILLLIPFSFSLNVITTDRPIKDAGDVLVSEKGVFALGFFSPGNSTRRYVGIWYNKVSERTVVWVANRDNPINDTSGILSIDATGNLALHARGRGVPVWKTNISAPATGNNNHSAQLLDSGNLLVFNEDRAAAWQSFDYPTHTVLPNMRLGVDRKTGLNRFLASWKSPDDPGTGEYWYSMNLSDSPPQMFIYKGSTRVWRTGSWNGLRWTGVPEMIPSYIFNITYIDNPEEVSIIFSMIDPSIMSRLVLNESGLLERYTWHGDYKRWVGFWSAPKDQCDFYGHCGANGNCDNSAAGEFECKCLPGFEPESPRDWYLRDGSDGCRRNKGRSVCGSGEGFVRMAGAKVPDTAWGAVNRSVGLGECAAECSRNCSCTAYTAADIGGGGGSGSGCITWLGELMDVRKFPTGGQDFYVRVDAIEFAQYLKTQRSGDKKRKVAAIWGSLAVVVLFVTIFLLCWLLMKKRRGTGKGRDLKHLFSSNRLSSYDNSSSGKTFHERETTADLPFFDFSAIAEATDNFSFANRLGQGGFGTVYKGVLPNGQEVAVKRLAKNSGQGIKEFKNEVTLIAKLQHRNLVRLLGCCIQHDEKILIYEYMPNKSLDAFIFDKAKGAFLDWRKRFDIVLGIARGMLYLHQDSRLRIIHRDLKASNILLDFAMNPKISDFGMARIFGGDQIEANTNRVVGTYGYMSPEYAMEGFFSIKSDVFSFGVLLLEIISGRKNSSYYQDDSVNLIGHVWRLWQEEKALEAVDSLLGDSYSAGEVLRCIHIGLLCVQESANDRPTMSDVVFMMCNDTALPSPKQPAFILKRKYGAADHSSSTSAGAGTSINDLTLTTIGAR